jgi:hypothetical protein
MALTLDGTTPMPNFGGGSGAGLGVGGGVLGGLLAGGLGGALAGGLFGNRGGWGGNGYGAAPAATAVATDVVLNPAFQSLQTQITNLGSQVASGDLNSILNSEFRRVNSAIDNSSADILNSVANLSTAQATSAFTTLQGINDLGRDITAQSNQGQLQQLNSFNNLTTTTLQGFNGAAMQNQNATNQIISQGTANAMAMAQCCCEIKSAIAADGGATRALINDLNVQSLRDQLATANGKVSNNEQNQYLLSTILAHFTPTAVV